MLTTRAIRGHRPLLLLLALVLSGCAPTPVLHEFPPALAPAERPPAAVSYTLRVDADQPRTWLLRGEQGDVIGTFRTDSAAQGQLFQDGMNARDFLFRVGAADTMRGFESAAPRVTIFDAATGRVAGTLELRTGFDRRYEGMWRDGAVFWRAELLPEGSVERAGDDGNLLDTWPAARVSEWSGGSNAGLTVISGREVAGEQFGDALHDIAAGRPLTRRELGDAIVMFFAMRALDEATVDAAR